MKKPFRYKLGKPITASPVVYDLDNDGTDELIIAADKLYAYKLPSFKLVGGFPVMPTAPAASTPFVFTEKDGKSSIYFGSDDDRLYGVSSSGIPKTNFPIRTGGDVFTSPFSADIDGDGYQELIFGSDDGRIFSIKLGHDGNNLNSIRYFETGGFVSSSPALLPKEDNSSDIIGCSWDEHIYRLNGNSLSAIWKKPTGHIIWASPIVADINNDGRYEILFANNQLHVLDQDGNSLSPFPLRLGSWTVSSPALCDLSSDNNPEIITCADSVYVHTIDGGSPPGFPLRLRSPVWASPITVDIDGDGYEEIIICDYNGNMFAISREGNVIDSYSRTLGTCIVSTPLAIDIDKDGLLEIVICTFDGVIWILPTDGRKSTWPTFRGGFNGGVIKQKSTGIIKVGNHKQETVHPLNVQKPPPIDHIPSVRIRRKNRGRAVFYELHLAVRPGHSLNKGMMYFLKNNKWGPSPLFGNGEYFVARFPPYRRFSRVHWYAELTDCHGNTVRIPENGFKSFRVY